MDTSETALVIAGVAAVGVMCYSTFHRSSTYRNHSTQCSARHAVSAKAARTWRPPFHNKKIHSNTLFSQHKKAESHGGTGTLHAVDSNFGGVSDDFHAQMKPMSFDRELANRARASVSLRKTHQPITDCP